MLNYHPTYNEVQKIVALGKIKEIEICSRDNNTVCLCIDAHVFERFGIKFLDRVSTPKGNGTVIGIGELANKITPQRPYGQENLWFQLDMDTAQNKGVSYWEGTYCREDLLTRKISLLIDEEIMQQPINPCLLHALQNILKYSYWIINYHLNKEQAQAIQDMVLRTWFLYAHEFVDKNILPPEIIIHIASYLTAPTLPTHELTDLFEKYVSGRYQRFLSDALKKRSEQLSNNIKNIDAQLGELKSLFSYVNFFCNPINDKICHLLGQKKILEKNKNQIDHVVSYNDQAQLFIHSLKKLEKDAFYDQEIEPRIKKFRME